MAPGGEEEEAQVEASGCSEGWKETRLPPACLAHVPALGLGAEEEWGWG